ncbi:hypothetical protein [Peribacillus butanolivorans]
MSETIIFALEGNRNHQAGWKKKLSDINLDGEHAIPYARSAIGTNVLPLNLPVEIEMVLEIEE